jgi:hypothetical protein
MSNHFGLLLGSMFISEELKRPEREAGRCILLYCRVTVLDRFASTPYLSLHISDVRNLPKSLMQAAKSAPRTRGKARCWSRSPGAKSMMTVNRIAVSGHLHAPAVLSPGKNRDIH